MSRSELDGPRRGGEIREVLASLARTLDELSRSSEQLLAPEAPVAPPAPRAPTAHPDASRVEAELREAAATLLVFAEGAEQAARAVGEARALGDRLRAAAANAALESARDRAGDASGERLRREVEAASHEVDHLVETCARMLREVPSAVHRSVMSFEAIAARLATGAHPGAVAADGDPGGDDLEPDAVTRRHTERAASELIALGKRLRALVTLEAGSR